MKLLIATTNQGKLKEVSNVLREMDFELLGLDAVGPVPFQEETGSTFAENARMKALVAAKATGLFSLSDDSGLVVPALDGAPGLHSARFAGEGASDADNRVLLLDKLQGVDDRSAYFVCALCLAGPGGVLWEGEGKCHGTIINEARGESGFGYDPIFLHPLSRKTFAQLMWEEKSMVSHRGEALRLYREALKRGIDGFNS